MTDFKPGDRVLVPGVVVEHNGLLRVEVEPTDTEDALPIDHDPDPYTVACDGDEVEVTVRGVVRRAGNDKHEVASVHRPDGALHLVNWGTFADALAEGRVRLVRAAAPSYEPGMYSSATTGRWVLYPVNPARAGDSAWLHIDAHRGGVMWHDATTIPADLVPCDVVPRGEPT